MKARIMPDTSYYFVNHSLSQFCLFDSNISIFNALEATLIKWPKWTKDHDICVLSHEHCREEKIDNLLYERGYKWLDILEAGAENDENALD
jgi:cupin superfamily acireductone dioxygenase involved in methionine salvage